jgi:N-acetylglutamate synthase-like GNAT family acetyltransferase
MTSYWVRPARPADRKAVTELARRVRREFHLAVRGSESPGGAKAAELMWVVEAGRGQIVGCCGVREDANGVWELHSLFLAPDWRGFGLGRSLVEQAMRSAQGAGALALTCSVPAEYAEATALLRGLGFAGDAGDGAHLRFTRALGHVS